MRIVVLIARLLLGLMFLVFGSNTFLHFIPMQPPPGMAGTFLGVLAESHYTYFVGAFQVLCAVLLLINQFVPFALIVLAPIIANIIVFHVTMQPAGLPPGLFAAILWLIVAYRHRASFYPLIERSPSAPA